jgi:hypothetical protein
MISNVNLTLLADVRSCSLVRGDRKFRTSELYGILKRPERTEEAMDSFIWNNKTPPRVQFFAWLLAQEKTQCKTNLRKKRILEEDVCEECAWSGMQEKRHAILRWVAVLPNYSGKQIGI